MRSPDVLRRAASVAAAALILSVASGQAPKKAAPEVVLAAGEQSPKDHVRASVFLSTDRLPAGGTAQVAVVLDVESGWHVNSNPAGSDFLVPTAVAIKSAHGTTLAGMKYPKGKIIPVDGLDEPLSVYDGRVVMVGTLTVPPEAAGKTEELNVEVKFQACDDTQCLAPKTAKLTGKVPVAAAGEQVKKVNETVFEPKKPTGA